VGELFVSGLNDEKQLDSSEPEALIASPHLLESVTTQRLVGVSCGERHNVVLSANWQPLAFGSNEHGACAHSPDGPVYGLPRA
jgi:alpha-tubulin suppressor-like RCC1 family protein